MAVATIKDLLDPLTKIQATSQSSSESLDAISIALGAQVKSEEALLQKLDRLIKVSSGAEINAVDFKMLVNLRKQTKLLEAIAAKKGGGGGESGGKAGGKGVKDGAAVLGLLGAGAKTMAAGMMLFSIVPKGAIKKFKTALFDIYEIMGNLDGKNVKDGAESFKIMSDSIGKFAVNLVKATLLLPIAFLGIKLLGIVIKALIPAFENLGKQSKTINKGAKSLDLMGSSLLSFAKGLVLAGLAAIVGIIAIPFLIISMILIGGAMALLGKLSKPINRGARSLDKIGDALKSFAVGLALFAITTFFILMSPVILIGMVASLVLIGGAVALLGVFSKQINKGSVALALMGIGLAIFGLGYAVFAFTVAKTAPTLEAVAMQAGILIGLGIATALLGVMFGTIIQGVVSLAAMGIGLLIFGLGYTPFAEATKDTTLGDIGIQAGVLTALGGVFALAGLGVIPIVAGGVAFGAVGLALQALAPGLKAMQKVNFTEQDALNLTTTLAGVKAAFIGPPSKGGVSGFFSSIGSAIVGTVDAGGMVAAAVGFGAAGLALTKLSEGLKAYQKLDWTNEQSLELATVLSGISAAFAQAGGEAATPTGLFGAVFGNAFSPNATKKGIDAVMDAGKALTNIAEGLKAFQALVDKEVDFDVLGAAITLTVGVVQSAFAAIGGEGNVAQGGFFGSLLGLEQNKVEEGIDSVMNAGDALTGIAKGLGAFQTLVEREVDFDVLGVAISKTVGFVQEAFAAVATEGNVEAGGFFNSLFGIKKNKVAEGIDSVSGAGDALTGIAKGLTAFQTLVESEVDFDAVGAAISKSVGFVQEAFAAVADQGQVKAGGFWGSLLGIKKNKVQEGIQSVQGAGDELKKIADALSTFSGLPDVEGTAGKIKTVLGLVGGAFASIGGMEETDGNWFISWDENKVQKGIEAVDGAGDALTDIAAGLAAFSGDFEPVKVANSVATLLTSIGTAFSDLYATNPFISTQLRDFSGFIVTLGDVAEKGLLDKAADGISKIADSINKIDIDKTVAFGDLFNSSAKLSDDRNAYKALSKAVEDIRDIMQKEKGPNLLERVIDGAGLGGDKPSAPTKKTGADPMKRLNSTLGRLESAITSLPTAIQTMKLEVSMPGQ